jgi:hypothetical protein
MFLMHCHLSIVLLQLVLHSSLVLQCLPIHFPLVNKVLLLLLIHIVQHLKLLIPFLSKCYILLLVFLLSFVFLIKLPPIEFINIKLILSLPTKIVKHSIFLFLAYVIHVSNPFHLHLSLFLRKGN